MSGATDELMGEHRAIERVIGLLERARVRIESGEPVDAASLGKAHAFIRDFADRCHHAKEEGVLFPVMVRRGVPNEGGPVGVMLHEHELGRQYARGLGAALPGYAAGDKQAAVAVAANIRGYAGLLLPHIQKEDRVLYPLSDRVLSEADKAALAVDFERVEQEVTGPGEHERHLAMIEELAAAVA